MPRKDQASSGQKHKVAVIGAGVAGCAMAGALQDYGIEFEVFDRNDGAGGLWADNYPGASVQSTTELYEYPGKKFPEHIRNRKNPPAPTAKEVCDYLEEYIDEKGMRSRFRFKCNIASISCISESEWVVEFDDFRTKHFTFVIVCTGLVSTKPRIIDLPGKAKFIEHGGVIQHSSVRRSDEIFDGKRVLVIGNGKSAVDAVTAAAKIAKENGSPPPIQMARRQTWYVPRYILGFIQYKWAFHTRIGSLLLPVYFEIAWIWKVVHYVLSPLKWIIWRVVELLLLLQYRLPPRLWPKLNTIEQTALENSVLITDSCHMRRIRKGFIDLRIGEVQSLKPGKAVLSDGTEEDVDVVVMATGWSLGFDLVMDSDYILSGLNFEGGLDVCQDGMWCYRNILPAAFKGLGFVGSNTLTFMNIYTSYIQAYWLAQLLAGVRKWPDKDQMMQTVEREKKFKRKLYPNSDMRAASIEMYMQHYHDVLFREMNASKPFNCLVRPIANLIVPVTPAVMTGCLEPENSIKLPLPPRPEGMDGRSPQQDDTAQGSDVSQPVSLSSTTPFRVNMTGECISTGTSVASNDSSVRSSGNVELSTVVDV
ncbi:monooxygenase [Nitzschia inconspicua]|uniref:Monooxygenase n=1 Tax=Nitzschia inconspicua TaxID=303405 RepID=A0A9K3Q794_9STRA|nr:monooxygenase [Nitzschia inconspicua]